jgi:hypothetical protein
MIVHRHGCSQRRFSFSRGVNQRLFDMAALPVEEAIMPGGQGAETRIAAGVIDVD